MVRLIVLGNPAGTACDVIGIPGDEGTDVGVVAMVTVPPDWSAF